MKPPAFRDPRSFRDMWEDANTRERWSVALASLAIIIAALAGA